MSEKSKIKFAVWRKWRCGIIKVPTHPHGTWKYITTKLDFPTWGYVGQTEAFENASEAIEHLDPNCGFIKLGIDKGHAIYKVIEVVDGEFHEDNTVYYLPAEYNSYPRAKQFLNNEEEYGSVTEIGLIPTILRTPFREWAYKQLAKQITDKNAQWRHMSIGAGHAKVECYERLHVLMKGFVIDLECDRAPMIPGLLYDAILKCFKIDKEYMAETFDAETLDPS